LVVPCQTVWLRSIPFSYAHFKTDWLHYTPLIREYLQF
jgi:hypothetical protein